MDRSVVMAPSSWRVDEIPAPQDLIARWRALALLDELFRQRSDNWCFRFEPLAEGGVLASWDDGSGNQCHLRVGEAGALLWGFDHECPMSPWASNNPPEVWPGLLDGMPGALTAYLKQKPFDRERVSFCLWHVTGVGWSTGDVDYPEHDFGDPDGSRSILTHILESREGVTDWAESYYGCTIDEEAVGRLLSAEAMDAACILSLAPGADVGVAGGSCTSHLGAAK
eukprot:jgi/Chlat1/8178/Chrsp76S07656